MSSTVPAIKIHLKIINFKKNQCQVNRGSTQNRKTWLEVYETRKFGDFCCRRMLKSKKTVLPNIAVFTSTNCPAFNKYMILHGFGLKEKKSNKIIFKFTVKLYNITVSSQRD